MILSEYVLINTNNRNYRRFIEIGYNFKVGDVISVKVCDLSKSSRSIVDVKCDICGKEKKLKYSMYIKNVSKYNLYTCDGKCSNIKYKKTCLEKFGCEYPLQNLNIKNNLKLFFSYKYGVDHPSKLEEFELKKQNTNFEKYGVKHQMFLMENIDKIKKTKFDIYGDENYNNHDKCRLTKIKKYNNEYYNNHDKCKLTKMVKYDDEYYNNHNKYVKTCLEKYNVENIFQLEEIKDKIKLSNLEKYGVEYYQGTDEYRNKYKDTCLDKYGVDNPSKVKEIHEKQQMSGFRCFEYNGLFYRGTYELDFIKFCERNKIIIKKSKKIKYFINDVEHYYFPDFFIPKYNLIIEVKSMYYYKLNENINILKKEYTINSGYNFLFIIDKDYIELEKIIKFNGINSLI